MSSEGVKKVVGEANASPPETPFCVMTVIRTTYLTLISLIDDNVPSRRLADGFGRSFGHRSSSWENQRGPAVPQTALAPVGAKGAAEWLVMLTEQRVE